MTHRTDLPTALIADEISKAHDTGPGHPECAARFDAVMQRVTQTFDLRVESEESRVESQTTGGEAAPFRLSTLDPRLSTPRPRPATLDEIALCHDRDYVELVQREIAAGSRLLSTGDTHICRNSLEPALYAAGGACAAVDAVFEGKAKNAFCVHRPPGHHASQRIGMGFCIFNNAAIAARYAQSRHTAEKVLIVDWDVHHGNGTQDIFYEDPSVLFFSTHQSPWYPGTGDEAETGEGQGLGTTLNCPLPAGSGRREVFAAFENELLPAAERFRPDLVIISAGFDGRSGDPLGQFRLTDDDFADLTALVMRLADEHAEGRVVSLLEGGYNLDGLASVATVHLQTLAAGCATGALRCAKPPRRG